MTCEMQRTASIAGSEEFPSRPDNRNREDLLSFLTKNGIAVLTRSTGETKTPTEINPIGVFGSGRSTPPTAMQT